MLNVTKTNAQIRSSDLLIWKRDGEFDLVTNGSWMIKADLRKGKYRKILGLLVERFALIPGDGETWQIRAFKNDGQPFKMNLDFSVFLDIPDEEVIDTHLEEVNRVNKRGILDYRIFKGKEYIYLNTKYVDMLKKDSHRKWFSKGNLNPVYTRLEEDEFFMVLPVRVLNFNEYLNKEDLSGMAVPSRSKKNKHY